MKHYLPATVALLALVLVALSLRNPTEGEYHTAAFGRLPVLVNGRVKPLDTVARTSLLMMQGRQRVTLPNGTTLSPTEWLLDMLYKPHQADRYQVFEVTHPELLALLGVTAEEGAGNKRFSLTQFNGKLGDVDRQSKLADSTDQAARTTFQRAVIQLRDSVALYQRLQSSMVAFGTDDFLEQVGTLEKMLTAGGGLSHTAGQAMPAGADAKFVLEFTRILSTMDAYTYFQPIPPPLAESTRWQTIGQVWTESVATGKANPAAVAYATMGRAWQQGQPAKFNAAVQVYRKQLDTELAPVMRKSGVEVRFNNAQPFYSSMVLYVVAFVLAVISWLKWPDTLRQTAFGLLLVAFAVATIGIGVRMWLEARPPVTNLYSSALFVGWGAVALCLALEYFYQNAIASVAAGLIGFGTLLIAHHLSLGGDTLEMMRAVLDSNFWLATHVVTIAVGYSATFLAGFLALIYVLRGVFTRSLDQATGTALGRMIYGVICFATLFSFVGTILGGIWADQSWGRFWGWDPKENGALLIVLWNSILLHVRWAGLVKTRGLACLAIFGNIVTAWSWFGVNMLGVGLHSYGFMDSAFWWLVVFCASQLLVIAIAGLPLARWRSAMTSTPRTA